MSAFLQALGKVTDKIPEGIQHVRASAIGKLDFDISPSPQPLLLCFLVWPEVAQLTSSLFVA